MPKQNTDDNDKLPFVVEHKIISIVLVSTVILVIAISAWWRQVYNSPRQVFWGMLNTALSTQSVTRSSTNSDGFAKSIKKEQLSFVPQMATRTLVTIEQGTGTRTKVVSETIGTKNADYSRYLTIDTDQKDANGLKLNYKSLLNIWGKSAAGTAQNFQQASLGLLPLANLSATQRQDIIKLIEKKQVYTVDYTKVEPKRIDGKSALIIPVTVNTANYVEILKAVAKAGGISDTKDLKPEDYKDSQPIQLKLTVDKLSRQLLEVEYVGAGQKETYSDYGLATAIAIPDSSIAIDELQQRLQEVQ